ncbi:hypothetical protein [Shewanella aestuarii]|uniref:Uncharacterized protein n=1 Tax=Shewanella aestuarii TaxID=1028752 RepID=A0A6G9QPZ8_9GAMM|nr:hypothetical protein [Shewanella aestuarii]QIR16636.1 hypothetical protein HBH39_19360 [Shewanella aestuarii]
MSTINLDIDQAQTLNAYCENVQALINLMYANAEINDGFCKQAFIDDRTPYQAATDWFTDEPISFAIEEHFSKMFNLLDIDIEGYQDIRRAVFSRNIKDGQMFNVYHGQSSKSGAIWKTDLITSLKIFTEEE